MTATATRPARKRASRRKVADRATDYARRVLAGEIIAGPHVRAACQRHLRDLETAADRGLTWSVQHAEHAIAFFCEVLCLNGGQFEGQPFVPDHWQAFVIGSLHGWRRGDVRRFRQAYIETGKGSGKSPLAAGLGLFGLMADGEPRAEVYSAATKQDQAMILFRDLVAMVDQSKELSSRVTKSGVGERTYNISYPATGSFARAISSDNGQSGPRPHVALVDEYHEHPTNEVLEMLRAGFKFRRQALLVCITNSGTARATPCGDLHDHACKVAAGAVENDALFAFVCGLDPDDDPLKDEACWPKANPSLQFRGLPGLQYLREQVTDARGMPSKEALVRRLCFCQWGEAAAQWLTAAAWNPCQAAFDVERLRGRRAYAGLDLSSTTDLTALVLLVEPDDPGGPWYLLPWCWLPADGMQERCQRDRVDYATWVREGYIETTPGRAISKRHVLLRLMQIASQFELINVAYDRWRMADLVQLAADEGIELPPMVEFGQGYRDMGPAIDAFETAVLNRQVAHNGHPVLTMCAANAVATTDPAGNRKLDKAKATGRIDLMVAAVMAYAGAAKDDRSEPGPAFYNLNSLADA